MAWEELLAEQAMKLFCVRKRLVEAQEVYRAGRTRQVQRSLFQGLGPVSVWLRESGGIQCKGKAVSTTGGNPRWGIQWAKKC